MPITPASPYPKAPGQTIRSTDWNQTVDEIVRLDNAKVDRAGDTITGSLTINGALSVGVASTGAGNTRISNYLAVGPITAGPAAGRLEVSGATAELGFIRRSLTAPFPASPAAGDRYVWYNSDGNARLFTDVIGDLFSIASNGAAKVFGSLSIPKTTGGDAVLSGLTFINENNFVASNL